MPIGGGLATSTQTVLIENPLIGEASWENDLSIVLLDLTNSQFDEPLYYLVN